MWTIESHVEHWDPYPDAVGAGYNFAEILHEGIEHGMFELEYLQQHGMMCDLCGEFRLCDEYEVEETGGELDEKLRMRYIACCQCEMDISAPHWPVSY